MGILSSEREDDEDLKRPGEEQHPCRASPTGSRKSKQRRASSCFAGQALCNSTGGGIAGRAERWKAIGAGLGDSRKNRMHVKT